MFHKVCIQVKNRGSFVVGFLITFLFLGLIASGKYFCPFLALTGCPCPGCFMTRAAKKALVGDVSGALTYNAWLFPVFLASPFAVLFGVKKRTKALYILIAALAVFGIIYWFLRIIGVLNLPGA
jgi:hypothetical protein